MAITTPPLSITAFDLPGIDSIRLLMIAVLQCRKVLVRGRKRHGLSYFHPRGSEPPS